MFKEELIKKTKHEKVENGTEMVLNAIIDCCLVITSE